MRGDDEVKSTTHLCQLLREAGRGVSRSNRLKSVISGVAETRESDLAQASVSRGARTGSVWNPIERREAVGLETRRRPSSGRELDGESGRPVPAFRFGWR